MEKIEIEILKSFPGYEMIYNGENKEPPNLSKIAISVFESWLGSKRSDELNPKTTKEREGRNAKLLSLCDKLFETTSVYLLKDRFSEKSPPYLEEAKDKNSFLNQCRYDSEKTSDKFYLIFLPEFDAIYYENWDDTNILWFKEKNKIEQFINLVKDCGLYVLGYES